jgi:hypothetical protein
MKMIISNTLVTSVSASIATLAVHIQALRENHPYFKAKNEKRIKENMKIRNISEEESRKSSNFSFPTESLISFIKPKTLKYGSLTKTDNGIEIEINDNFLIESVELANSLYVKMLKPVADILGIIGDHQIISDQFNNRWSEETKTSNEIKEEKTDNYFGWKLKNTSEAVNPFFLDETNEEFINIYYSEWVNSKEQVLSVNTLLTQEILSSKLSLLETAKEVRLPPSLVNTIRNHYNFDLLTDPVEEVNIETANVIEFTLDKETNEIKVTE